MVGYDPGATYVANQLYINETVLLKQMVIAVIFFFLRAIHSSLV